MFVDKEKLKKLSKLSKIEIRDEDIDNYLDKINSDLEFLRDIDKINVDNLEPLTNSYDMKLRTYDDKISDGNKVDSLMKSAPKELYNYFIVPKVIENKK